MRQRKKKSAPLPSLLRSAENNTDRENICYTIYLTNQPDVQPILRDACLTHGI